MIVLASASPRRRELLKLILNDFECFASDVDEHIGAELSPFEQVRVLAERKAEKAHESFLHDVIIAADTLVFLGEKAMGQPTDALDAKRMLKELSGTEHSVLTGVCVIENGKKQSFAEETKVFFDEISDDEISDYVNTGEPMDKAGAYAIQGGAAKFVSHIEGCYFNVMGLPVRRLYRLLKEMYVI